MALTDLAVRNAKPKDKPYKVSDSGGLHLLVNPHGSKLWRFKYRLHGVERKLAIGAYPEVTLVAAREARDAARKQVASSIDPNAAKRLAKIEASLSAVNRRSNGTQHRRSKGDHWRNCDWLMVDARFALVVAQGGRSPTGGTTSAKSILLGFCRVSCGA